MAEKTRLASRVSWWLAGRVNEIAKTFTWEWAVWWTAALLRFSTTGQRVTVTPLGPTSETKEPQ